ncbi:MAG: hypothetical protein IT446_12530 [Phycisphaerales bacterium]|nr:hypothetical protein [Phycisphaerales bacterium]
MRVSAETFSIVPKAGGVGQSATAAPVERVCGGLQTTVTLLEDDRSRFCIISSHAVTHFYRFCNVLRSAVGRVLEIDPSHVLCFSSHNHCAFHAFNPSHPLAEYGRPKNHAVLAMEDLTAEGRMMLESACQSAAKLPKKLQEAEIQWALGHERRISYNRKGYRVDGSSYMIREEDRLRLGTDFNGDIDDEAPVIAFVSTDGKPICFLTCFTGHPATAYHPEHPVLFGEYPQIACEDLSAAHGGVPVGFLQGCGGDVNAKGVQGHKPIEQSLADATRYGHYLGETYRNAARSLMRCRTQDLGLLLQSVRLPFAGVPPLAELDAQIADLRQFIDRCGNGDSDTQVCQGLNFPSNMTPRYRAALVEPLLKWARWARSFHERNRLDEAPTGVEVQIAVLRLGEVGIVGLPCEPFDAIGRRIKRNSPCALTLACGYMNDDDVFYVPDSGNNGDREYQSAFYRYTTSLLPYAQPAGDALADRGVEILRKMATLSSAVT